MKFKMMGLLVAGMCVLSACSEIEETAAEPEKVEEPKKEVETPKKEEPKKEEPKAEVPKALSASEQEYGDFMINVYQQLPTYFDEITALTTDAVSDPMLLLDDSWREDIVFNYEMVTSLMEQVRDYENVPEKFKKAHDLQVKAADEYIASKQKFYDGIDNLDADLLFEASDHMQAGTGYITEAGIEIDKITAGMGN